jgi:type I restriction enzyme M protein
MALKKSELYSSLWESCNELRGGMDASQYKDYVLVLLFVKYVSDKFSGKPYAPITIPEGASFADMVLLKGKVDIGDQINKKILAPLAEANGLSDMPDFNDPAKLGDGKEKVDRLTNLIAIFENPALDFSQNRADGDDLLGDAYEYLMRHFATESGKSKGQFYTPAEVSRIMAKVLGIRNAKTTNDTTVYDPTCGSGSLLLKIGDEARRVKDVKVTLYGQEKDNTTSGLARMNMILHDYATADIKQGNTLANPLFKEGHSLKTFDYVVANPPFSDKRWSTGLTPDSDPYGRFEGYGIPPGKQGDYAYLLHILRSLKSTGKGACILPHGVLFRGNAEGTIRKNLIQRGLIKGIIGLPPNLFYGTGIPACIILLDKEEANSRKGIFMIDASKSFRKDGPKNRLREQDLHRIVDIFNRQVDILGFSRMVPIAEISDAKNDFNLNLPRYIDGTIEEDLQDLEAHLRGGIPNRDLDELATYWKIIPAVRATLFEEIRPRYSKLRIDISKIKESIFSHPEFTAFNEKTNRLFNDWKAENIPSLINFGKGSHPKALIESLGESLLSSFEKAPLLDCYDIYQYLMDFWDESMQDDCYLIASDGWKEAARPRLLIEEKGRKNKASPDLVVGKKKYIAELIPPSLIISRYFSGEQLEINSLDSKISRLEDLLAELAEDQGIEGGLLEEAKNEKDKLTKASVTARLREVKNDADSMEERESLENYLALVDQQSTLASELKNAQDDLMEKSLEKYGQLSEVEIKALVIEDKWIATLEIAVQGEMNRVSQALTGRIRELAERYASPLPEITDNVQMLSNLVNEQLKMMGVGCN